MSLFVSARRVASLALSLLVLTAITGHPQERLRPLSEGDGRVHGAVVMPVSEAELHPGQVQTLNLMPGYHTVVEFPYPVARIDAGLNDFFQASVIGNKVMLKATTYTPTETSLSLILGDADLTVVPFLIRADSTQPHVYIVRYTDPVAKHLNAAEAAIAARLRADEDQHVSQLADERVEQRLLLAGDAVTINQRVSAGRRGELVTLSVESAQTLPGADGQPRLYIRYRVFNQTPLALDDLTLTLRVIPTRRSALAKGGGRDLFDIQDKRTAAVVPAGGSIVGLLILDRPDLSRDDALSLHATAFRQTRTLHLDRILVGR